ncbi:hypothetical protein L873DRAFT_1816993 [Choiromyces venosus 120613-1]|uniref:Uncharacterized protein n=1 Tax=Choiromyces venosus 120613-1 TaxID=1336337 RepID=A0A3N4J861_9PEZI|nr:hypothetical protein L873DRAFT_1816993 [Choiromyces venosus 120613-1]
MFPRLANLFFSSFFFPLSPHTHGYKRPIQPETTPTIANTFRPDPLPHPEREERKKIRDEPSAFHPSSEKKKKENTAPGMATVTKLN